MNVPAQNIIALPARLNKAECAALRAELQSPKAYGNYYNESLPYCATIKPRG